MKRSSRFIKRGLALILVLLFSIESFAAVVGDNDGAAFITKAEFDSMKNDFQSQLDRYNSSIDNKVDGAIAAYLAGISVSKQVELKNLVPNYSDMVWVNTFKLYGRWKKWTSNTANTKNLTDNWFVPSFNEKRLGLRYDNGNETLTLYDPLYNTDGYVVLALDLKPTKLYDGMTIAMRNGTGDGLSRTNTPTLYIKFEKPAGKDYWLPSTAPFRNAWTLMNVQHIKPHLNADNGNFYLTRAYQAFFDFTTLPPFTFLPTSGNQIYNLKYNWAYGNSATVTYTHTSYSRPLFSDFMFPYLWVDYDAFNDNSNNNMYNYISDTYNQTALLNDTVASQTYNYFDRGVTFQVLSGGTNRTNMINYFLKMMMGKDTKALANAGYTVTNNGSQTYDFSTATVSSLVEFDVASANLSGPKYKDKGTTGGRQDMIYYPPSGTTANMTFPLWPTIALADINSNYFNYNNAPLTKGQGLPIASNIVSNGVLHINATYTTDRIISSYTNVGIEVDVADRAFTEQDVKYFEGYDDDVDPNTTMKTIKSLHNLEIDNTEKTIKLSIPVKKEDNVWLRIAPDTTDGGYYATLKDLKVTLVSQ